MGGIVQAIFGGGQQAAPPPPPPPAPTVDTESVNTAAAEERKRRSLAQGQASNMLTEGEDSTATSARKKLLGS